MYGNLPDVKLKERAVNYIVSSLENNRCDFDDVTNTGTGTDADTNSFTGDSNSNSNSIEDSRRIPKSEVSRYYDMFSKSYKLLEIGSRIESAIKKGNAKAIRTGKVEEQLLIKIEYIGGKVVYSSGSKGKNYSEDNDCALLYLMYKHGYDNNEKIKKDLCQMKIFQFDYYILSRKYILGCGVLNFNY